MFRTDPASVERLAHSLDPRRLAWLKGALDDFDAQNLLALSPEDLRAAHKALDAAASLHLEARIYAFHVVDSFTEAAGADYEGVELYRRHGDTLRVEYQPESRDRVSSAEECVAYLRRRHIAEVFTGGLPITDAFLGLERTTDPDDPIERSALTDDDRCAFGDAGIAVHVLEPLV